MDDAFNFVDFRRDSTKPEQVRFVLAAPKVALNIQAIDIFGKWLVDPGFKVSEGYAIQNSLCVADLENGFYCSIIFAPGTVLVVFDMFNDTGFDGIELCSTSSLQGIADASIALRLLRSSVLMNITE